MFVGSWCHRGSLRIEKGKSYSGNWVDRHCDSSVGQTRYCEVHRAAQGVSVDIKWRREVVVVLYTAQCFELDVELKLRPAWRALTAPNLFGHLFLPHRPRCRIPSYDSNLQVVVEHRVVGQASVSLT